MRAVTGSLEPCKSGANVQGGGPDDDAVELAFELVSLPWSCLGLIEEDERLTALGAWALPRAFTRAWGRDPSPP